MEELFLHPITQWHLYADFKNGRIVGGRIEIVQLFAVIAAFILVTGLIAGSYPAFFLSSSLLTVSYQAIRAVMANPVKSLRTE